MDDWETGAAVLRLATQLVDAIQDGLADRGFDDVRPAHGFAFVRLSSGDATTSDLAEHLGVTKQAASQLVEQLVAAGYVRRAPDPRDARARLLLLTTRGRACTAAAEQVTAEAVDGWREQLSRTQFSALQSALDRLVVPGRLRPAW